MKKVKVLLKQIYWKFPVELAEGNGLIGGVVFLLYMSVVYGVTLAIFIATFNHYDRVDVEFQESIGIVIQKDFIPEHITTQYVNKQVIIINHDDEWNITVEIEEQEKKIEISKVMYDTLSKNDSVFVKYQLGKFSGDVYLDSVSLM